MRVIVDSDLCMGCGVCESIAPDIFELGDELHARSHSVIQSLRVIDLLLKKSIAECPEVAIIITEE